MLTPLGGRLGLVLLIWLVTGPLWESGRTWMISSRTDESRGVEESWSSNADEL
jgi:hypothetical protein